MENSVVRWHAHGLESPEVIERMKQPDSIALARVERFNARAESTFAQNKRELNAVVNRRGSLDSKIREFYRVTDAMTSHVGDDVACGKGCSHCCHICVLITEQEAAYIGSRIGRKPVAKVKTRTNADGVEWGYHNPCTFLVNNECSIYENRPLACRVHFNFDIDALMCELTPPESKKVPFMNDMPFIMAFLQMLGVPRIVPKLADIRDFFPRLDK